MMVYYAKFGTSYVDMGCEQTCTQTNKLTEATVN